MSFSLGNMNVVKQIKSSNGQVKRDAIAKCYVVIKKQEKITENIRKALTTYLTTRLKSVSSTNLSSDLLQDNIIELLEFCTHKIYEAITMEDVIECEDQILQQIYWCTKHMNTKRLVFDEFEYNSSNN